MTSEHVSLPPTCLTAPPLPEASAPLTLTLFGTGDHQIHMLLASKGGRTYLGSYIHQWPGSDIAFTFGSKLLNLDNSHLPHATAKSEASKASTASPRPFRSNRRPPRPRLRPPRPGLARRHLRGRPASRRPRPRRTSLRQVTPPLLCLHRFTAITDAVPKAARTATSTGRTRTTSAARAPTTAPCPT